MAWATQRILACLTARLNVSGQLKRKASCASSLCQGEPRLSRLTFGLGPSLAISPGFVQQQSSVSMSVPHLCIRLCFTRGLHMLLHCLARELDLSACLDCAEALAVRTS